MASSGNAASIPHVLKLAYDLHKIVNMDHSSQSSGPKLGKTQHNYCYLTDLFLVLDELLQFKITAT